jgi:hypothetical protein
MTLSDLAPIGSFISGLAVLVSLVFLCFQRRQVGAQVQQTELHQQASIRQGRQTMASRSGPMVVACVLQYSLCPAFVENPRQAIQAREKHDDQPD